MKQLKSLQSLCVDSYLLFLEEACAVFVQLLSIDNKLLAKVRDGMIDILKDHLKSNLSGLASSCARDMMVKELVETRRFPSAAYLHKYVGQQSQNLSSSSEQAVMEQVKDFGIQCNSICCTGAFIVETMLCIIMNEDLREISIKNARTGFFLKNVKREPTQHFVPFQIPTVLAHYAQCIEKTKEEKTAKLEKIQVENIDSFYDTLPAFLAFDRTSETSKYLKFHSAMKPKCGIEAQRKFPLLFQDAMKLVFSWRDKFPNLTVIELGENACSSYGEKEYSNATAEILGQIGLSCPKLQTLKLSDSFGFNPYELLQLFLSDPYSTLHKYMYCPNAKLNDQGYVTQPTRDSSDYEVVKHDTQKHCFYCFDEWCSNGLRAGAGKMLVPFKVIDNFLYDHILKTFGEEKAKHYLCHVLKSTDLVSSFYDPHYTLVRAKPRPCEPGFIPPATELSYDFGLPWYMPDKVEYKAEYHPNALHRLTESLEYLNLMDAYHSMSEVVPFLLTILPNLKSLGKLNIVPALRKIKTTPILQGISAKSLKEIQLIIESMELNTDSDFYWLPDEVLTEVEAFLEQSTNTESDPVANLTDKLRNDVKLIAELCPNLEILHVCARFDHHDYANEQSIWQPLAERLANLKTLNFRGNKWSQVEPLFRAVGPQLKFVSMTLKSPPIVPLLNDLLDLCPHLESLATTFDRRPIFRIALFINDPLLRPEARPCLKIFESTAFLTKSAFMYLWARTPNLKEIKTRFRFKDFAERLEQAEEELTIEDINNLFGVNQMEHLETISTSVMLSSIEAACLFIEKLKPMTKKIALLEIRTTLPRDDYTAADEFNDDLQRVRTRMKEFKEHCLHLKATSDRSILWRWNPVGLLKGLQSFSSIYLPDKNF